MTLSQSQRALLEMVHSHDGEWNWYKLGRACIGMLDSPAELTLRPLLEAGFVEERPFKNEPLPRIHVTDKGRQQLQQT